MSRTLTLASVAAFLAMTVSDVHAQNGIYSNGAKVGKDGYILNIIAFDRCPSGEFLDSNRRQIAVKAYYPGDVARKLISTNKIFLQRGDDFQVKDGNACDNGAKFLLPVVDNACSNCDGGDVDPEFTQYKVYARLVGKPESGVSVTSCVEVVMIDPITLEETLESLCSVSDNVWVRTRTVGSGKVQNKWDNVSKELLTICVDTDDDGVCNERYGLFDTDGEDYWWNWGTQGRPHVQLVFVPVNSGP